MLETKAKISKIEILLKVRRLVDLRYCLSWVEVDLTYCSSWEVMRKRGRRFI